jgi:hypothetical protein
MTRFFELLIKYQEDEDVFYQRMMEAHALCFAVLHSREPEIARQLIAKFTSFVALKSWPFSYTDRIADRCKALFLSINDFAIRAEILQCLLQMGVGHNRWHVMGRFSELLQLPKDAAEALIAHDKLKLVEDNVRQKAASNLNVAKLSSIIKPLFEF